MGVTWDVIHGDAIDVLKQFADGSVDAIVTDPPYGLEFMGKDWDRFTGYQQWCEQWAAECLRVAKPGAHLLAFGGTRTYHRLACAIEDAGWGIRDSLHWIYGSGFPKSMDVSKAIDKAAGAERTEVTGMRHRNVKPYDDDNGWNANNTTGDHAYTAPATEDAAHWSGWGTALKPAHEPIVVARKPLAGTVVANVLEHGTGALNIDGCRVGSTKDVPASPRRAPQGPAYGELGNDPGTGSGWDQNVGRWSPNILLTHSEHCSIDGCAPDCPVGEMDGQSGNVKDYGGASRFFPCFRYQAKAPKRERPHVEGIAPHPTVKPVELMRWLVRLVTPPDGLVLDPFAGTGTTAEACVLEERDCVLIERDADYIRLIEARMATYEEVA